MHEYALKKESIILPETQLNSYVAQSTHNCWNKELVLEYVRLYCQVNVPDNHRLRETSEDEDTMYRYLQVLIWEYKYITINISRHHAHIG